MVELSIAPSQIDRKCARRSNAVAKCGLIVSLLLLTLVSIATVQAAVAADDQRFVDGLRQRRLFSLAESFCLQQLDRVQSPDPDVADWSIELIRVYSEQAVNLTGSARDAAWKKAADVAEQFELANPRHPRLPLVQTQAALAVLAQGELARMEAEVGSMPEAAISRARSTIREAANKLESLDEHLTKLIPLASRNARQPGALSGAELSSLQQNVRYQWARALRNQALCYPARSADRIAALTQTARMLEQPLQVLPSDDPLVARIKLDQAVCYRLLGELGTVETILKSLVSGEQTPSVRLEARAERLRMLIAAGKLDDSVKLLGQGRTIDGVSSAELDFAFLEVYVAQWRASAGASGNEDGAEWEKKSVAALEFIEQTYGPYWARRAELLLVGVNLRTGSGNVSVLDRAARDLYLKGRFAESVDAYDKAARTAETDGDREQAFALAYKAALIQQQQKNFRDSYQRFQRLALADRTNPLASNAHLLAVVNLAQEARSDPSLLSAYVALLTEHLRIWPPAESADTARLWLGQLHEARRQWESAVRNYSMITFASEHFPLAAMASIRGWTPRLEALESTDRPTEEVAQAAIRYCEQVLHRDAGELPKTWDMLDGECLIGMARIQLRYSSLGVEQLEARLRAAIENSEASVEWRSTAQSFLVLTVLGKPNGQRESQQVLAELGSASTDQLLELLAGIERAAENAPNLVASIGTLERDLADRLLTATPPLDASQRLRVAMIRAAALVKLGDNEAALIAYAKLAEEHSSQASVQVAYAERLLSSENEEQLRLGLRQWRGIASKTKPRTPRWFQAKYSVALVQFKLGDREAAAKLIRYLQATEDLASSGLEREFAQLLERCR